MCYKVSDCKTDIAPFHSSFLPFLGDFFTWTLDMFFSLRHLSQKQNYSNITIFSWKYLATHKKVLIIHYQTLRYKLQPFKCTFLGVNQSNTCSLLSKKLLFCCFKATLLLIKKVAKVCTEMAVTMPDYFHANFHLLLSFQLSTSDIRRLCSSASLQKCLLGLFSCQIFHIKM